MINETKDTFKKSYVHTPTIEELSELDISSLEGVRREVTLLTIH
jgi:hypothetical protein